MQKQFIVIALAVFSLFAIASADPIAPDEQAFLDKHTSDVVVVTPKRLDDPAVVKSFHAPIYLLTISINTGDNGNMTQTQIAARADEKLVPLSRPGTDGDCPAIQQMISPDFKLQTDDDAKVFQAALDLVFTPVTDDEKKAVAFRHDGHDWSFIRGKFFDKNMGFVCTTDDQGKITGVKFSLKLP